MAAGRRSGMEFDVLLGHVFGELLAFVDAVLVDRLAFAPGDEIVTCHAGFQRALVAVQRQRPRILRIGRIAPTAVLPDDGQVIVLEGSGLRVADI